MFLLRFNNFRISKLLKQKRPSVQTDKLIQNFKEQFIRKKQNYFQKPLLSDQGLLSYTSRFAQTVTNHADLSQNSSTCFKDIKNSINTKKKFTAKSCVLLCESLMSYSFQGDQNIILDKMRSYAKNNENLFTSKEKDRFIRAHKYLMTKNAKDPIKFIDFKMQSPKNRKQQIQANVKHIFKTYNINQYSIDWVKNQIQFRLKIGEFSQQNIIKVIGVDTSITRFDEIEVLKNRIIKNSQDSQCFLVYDNNQNFYKNIQQQLIAQKLLIDDFKCQKITQINQGTQNSLLFDKILKDLNQNYSKPLDNLRVMKLKEISYLNYILKYCSLSMLQQFFAYLKINYFHVQWQLILRMHERAPKAMIDELPALNFRQILETQQIQYCKMITQTFMQAMIVRNQLKNSPNKKIIIYIQHNRIDDFVRHFVQNKTQRLTYEKENRNSTILQDKLVLSSLIYNIPINLNIIRPKIQSFYKLLFPLTHDIRVKTLK